MYIRVSKAACMWGVGPIWATADDEKPTFIDVEKLPLEIRTIVQAGLESGKICEVDAAGAAVVPEQKVPVTLQQPTVDSEAAAGDSRIPPVIVYTIKQLLDNKVNFIKKNVDSTLRGANILAKAIEIEKQGKNRKTIISLLTEKLDKCDMSAPGLFCGTANIYDSLIEESETREIKLDRSLIGIAEIEPAAELADIE